MTSREIAELTGKLHKNVIVDCEAMFNGLKIQPVEFLDSYQDGKGETRKMYRLDKDLTMTLVTKYDTARRYAVVRRWRELEEQTHGRTLSLEEVLQLNQQLIEAYRNEASDKTSRMMLPKNLAAALTDRRKPVSLKSAAVISRRSPIQMYSLHSRRLVLYHTSTTNAQASSWIQCCRPDGRPNVTLQAQAV